METAIQAADPFRWERYFAKMGEAPGDGDERDPGPGVPLTDTAGGSGSGEPEAGELVHRICSVDVCEVFSPPRVGEEGKRYGLTPGDAMDLTTGWDFNLKSHRDTAERYIDEQKPLVVIGSPPCTPFSQLQSLNPQTEKKARESGRTGWNT